MVSVKSWLPAITSVGDTDEITRDDLPEDDPPGSGLVWLPGIAEPQPSVSSKERKVRQARTVFIRFSPRVGASGMRYF